MGYTGHALVIPEQSRDVLSNFGVHACMGVDWPWVIHGQSKDVQSNFGVHGYFDMHAWGYTGHGSSHAWVIPEQSRDFLSNFGVHEYFDMHGGRLAMGYPWRVQGCLE